jgi:hypothetical protein
LKIRREAPDFACGDPIDGWRLGLMVKHFTLNRPKMRDLAV